MKKLIVLLSIAIAAASSIPAQASNPQPIQASGKSWVPTVLIGGGAAISLGLMLYQYSNREQLKRAYRSVHSVSTYEIRSIDENNTPSWLHNILNMTSLGLVGLGGYCLGRQKK